MQLGLYTLRDLVLVFLCKFLLTLSAFSIFDPPPPPKKIPRVDSPDSSTYGEGSLGVLIDHYAENKIAHTLDGEEYEKEALITTEVRVLRNYIAKQPNQDMASQLKKLVTTDTLLLTGTIFSYFCMSSNTSVLILAILIAIVLF